MNKKIDNKMIIDSKLMKEWDYVKNKDLIPENLSVHSKEKAWWICDKGHSYESRIDSRFIGNGCPYCSGHRVLSGFNDLATKYPKVLTEWDYDKNQIKPDEVYFGSTKNADFICPSGHKYQMKIRDYYKGYNCPICAHRIIIPGVNDFASYDERLISEWDYTKNKIDPKNISPYYTKKVWWIGECGHEWEASVYSRTKMETNCPICAEERHASVSEKSVLFYLKKSNKYNIVLENYKDDKIKLELDIYIPEISTAIEYDGERWHRNIDKDKRKDKMCEENNIRLIRIRENGCPKYTSKSLKIYLSNNKTKGLEHGILDLIKILNIENIDVNIEKDNSEILSMINFMVKDNSISVMYPEIAKEWHPTKNGNLKPEHTKPNSNKVIWWICPLGHEYQLDVYHRTERGNGCPICSSHRALSGFNDLATLNPKLASQWNYKKNGELTPNSITANSRQKVWWIGECGHEWEASVSHRNNGNRGCPYCSGQKVLRGFNDLATTNPELLKEWDYDKNKISPFDVSSHSGKKVWWKCKECNYGWEATIDKRNNGRNCPMCARKKSTEKRTKKISKPVLQIDMNGKVINEFASIREAIRQTGCHGINEVVSGKHKQSGGFYWKYKNNEKQNEQKNYIKV